MPRIVSPFLLTVFLSLLICGCGEETETEGVILDPFELCLHVFDECEDLFFDGKQSECEIHLEPMDRCRQKCIYRENDCDNLDQCLFAELEESELVQQYCGFSENDGDADSENEVNPLPDGDF